MMLSRILWALVKTQNGTFTSGLPSGNNFDEIKKWSSDAISGFDWAYVLTLITFVGLALGEFNLSEINYSVEAGLAVTLPLWKQSTLRWMDRSIWKNNLIEIIKKFSKVFTEKKSFLFLHFLIQNIWRNGEKIVPLYQIKK
jgi:hypothetical protein